MKRSSVNLAQVADWNNLSLAFYRAAKGAGNSEIVDHFRANLDRELAELGHDIRNQQIELGSMTRFRIRDPKPRLIHAPAFLDRVLHHALIAHVGPLLDRALVDDTFACRTGKGGLAAVQRCQHHIRRFDWYIQIDIRHYFISIDHKILFQLLLRKFKDAGLLDLIWSIICAYQASPGCGLPIGALTSQHFANYYLSGLDRWLLERVKVKGMVRYMDDLVWFVKNKQQARVTLMLAEKWLADNLKLDVKPVPRVGRSQDGLLFCGYRIKRGSLLLSRRRKRRYVERRAYWEQAYEKGRIGARELQAGMAAVLGVTAHADAAAWRREQLRRQPLAQTLWEV